MPSISFTLVHSLPESVLAIGLLVLLLLGAWRGEKAAPLITELAVFVLGLAILMMFFQIRTKALIFDGAFIDDSFGRFMKALALVGSLVTLLMSRDFMRYEKIDQFEYPVLVLIATLGMLMLISAQNLIALYLGLELMSLSLYVVAAFHRDDVRASEAGLKYFVLGALSSGMLLYGASLLYGFSGSISFAGIARSIDAPSIGVVFGLVFLMTGLAFKMSVVPFHMWTPDVYEGAPTPVTAFFAAAPKMAAVAITVRVIISALPGITMQWQQIVVFIALLSMALGSFAAIGQTNIKRLMAYSSIGHMGFALVGLAAGTEQGVLGVLLYMLIYLIMTLGTFAAILSMRIEGRYIETIADLSGLAKTRGAMAFFLAVMMFSLAGIPPLAGFFAKWYVFLAAIQAGLYPLAVIGVVLSVIAAFYYLRIVKLMYFDDPRVTFDPMAPSIAAVLAVSSLVIVFFWVFPGPLVDAAAAAAKSLF